MIRQLVFLIIVCGLVTFTRVDGYVQAQVNPADIPTVRGDVYVQDTAGVLTPEQRAQLVNLGRELEQKTGSAQLAVLTVSTTHGAVPEEYATAAFRKFGLGDPKKNNGVLLFLATQDRKIRVEVGYGLEGTLPDGKVGRILDTYAIPYLKNNQIDIAILTTYKVLANEIAAGYGVDGAKPMPNEPSEQRQVQELSWWSSLPWGMKLVIGIGVAMLLFLDFKYFGGAITYSLLSMFRGRGGGGGGSAGGRGGSSGGGGAGRGW